MQVTPLTRGKEYGFRVCAMNAHGGASDFSTELVVVCDPSAVRGGGGGYGGGGGRSSANYPTLTHDALSTCDGRRRRACRPSNYVVELAEGEDGVVPDDEEWAVIVLRGRRHAGCLDFLPAPSTEISTAHASTLSLYFGFWRAADRDDAGTTERRRRRNEVARNGRAGRRDRNEAARAAGESAADAAPVGAVPLPPPATLALRVATHELGSRPTRPRKPPQNRLPHRASRT